MPKVLTYSDGRNTYATADSHWWDRLEILGDGKRDTDPMQMRFASLQEMDSAAVTAQSVGRGRSQTCPN